MYQEHKAEIKEDGSCDKGNGHSAASGKIMEGFSKILGKDCAALGNLDIDIVQSTAKVLYKSSNTQIGI